MEKEFIPFGREMGFKVAFSNALGIDLARAKRLIFISGQIAFDEKGNFIGAGDIEAQTRQILKNIQRHLEKMSGKMDDIVQVTVFVKNMSALEKIHQVRLQFFQEPYPTSTLVEVKGFVHPEALIEINALAII